MCSLSKDILKMLNEQVSLEASSSASYLSMAAWCDIRGLCGSAAYLYNHSEEERKHMLKIFHYISDAGGIALSPEVTNIKNDFSGLSDIFSYALDSEVAVTESISKLVDCSFTIKDFTTFNFLQWFVSEQREEEMITRKAFGLFSMFGADKNNGTNHLYIIDRAIGKLKSHKLDVREYA